MNLKLVSYNSTNINDGTNYNGFISSDISLQGDARIIEVQRAGRRPVFASKILDGHEMKITIQMLGTVSTQLDTLKTLFDVEDETPHQLIVKDTANSDKLWYVYATTKKMPTMPTHQSVEIVLSISDPVWYESVESTASWTISASGDTASITVAGNLPARPRFVITPTTAGGDRYAYRRLAVWRNPNSTALRNYPLNVVDSVWDTDALTTAKMQTTGDDLRIYVNGRETNRWLQSIDTTQTKVWCTVNFSRGIQLSLASAMTTAALTTITMKNNTTNVANIKKLPRQGTVLIGSELFTYTGININKLRLTGVTRAAKNTSAATHAANAAVYWIQHEIWAYYGNATATAPDTDDTKKPIIDLTSTNTSWVYTSFYERTMKRAACWKPAVLSTTNIKDRARKSTYYTANQGTYADPATEMGAVIKAWKSGAVWKPDNASIEWRLYNPATFTHITATGEKYRVTSNWPSYARFEKSANGINWDTVWTEATPTTAATWTALATHSSVSIGSGYDFVRFRFRGSVGATADNYAAHEIESATMTLSSTGVPQGTFNAEESIYFLDSTLTNNTTGEYIKFKTSVPLNKPVTIDCENKLAYLEDGTPVPLEFSSVRKDWLNMSVGANELQFDDTGTAGVSVAIYWRDRNS